MKIGVPKEILDQECRVALTPAGTHALVSHGHSVFIENNAGLESSFSNDDYVDAGAKISPKSEDVFNIADLILKQALIIYAV